MQTFAEIAALREQIKQFKRDGRTVAFVPTMGNLHEGHLTLVKKARELADIVVVSIFVNPMQFDRADDLNNYPRTLEADLSKLTGEGVELVFTPTPEVMYPDGLDKQTFVEVPGISHMLEGASRPATSVVWRRLLLSYLISFSQTLHASARKTSNSLRSLVI